MSLYRSFSSNILTHFSDLLLILEICMFYLLLTCFSTGSVYAQETSTDHQKIYQEVYLSGELLVKKDRIKEAIKVYSGALKELRDDGRVHLRLAQLYEQLKDSSKFGWIAHHYMMCTRDQNMDSLIRDQICEREVKSRFSPLLISGAPNQLEILAPEPFHGVTTPNVLLPNGSIVLRFLRRGAQQSEVINLRLPLQAPFDLGPKSFMPTRPKLSASELLGNSTLNANQDEAIVPPSPSPTDPFAVTTPQNVPAKAFQLPQWPAYLLFVLGVASAGVGVYTYLNIEDFSGNYLGEELPIVLFGSAAASVVIGGSWLAISW